MANFKYFSECGGQAVQLTNVFHSGQGTRAKDFTGTCPACGSKHIAGRMIEFKQHARRHECDARCVNASGLIMRCECSCGGKNHGRGSMLLAIA